MQIVIDIPESYYDGVLLDRILETTLDGILEAIKNGTPLSDNVTNGDVIKALFPNQPIYEQRNVAIFYGDNMRFDPTWWELPFEGVKK